MRPYTLNDISNPETQARIEKLLLNRQKELGRAEKSCNIGFYQAAFDHRDSADQLVNEVLEIVGLIKPAYEFQAHARSLAESERSG